MAAREKGRLAELLAERGSLCAADVQEAAAEGDAAAYDLIRQAGHTLGRVLGKLDVFFNPSVLIIGGGVSGFGETYLSFIREATIEESAPWTSHSLLIRSSTFGDKSGVIGSAMLCIQNIFKEENITF